MTASTPRFLHPQDAVPPILGPVDDMRALLHAYAATTEEMLAIVVDGDWHYDGEGGVDMESLFGDFASQAADDKLICAIVITGNLTAPNAVLADRDTDWAPALIVGGNVSVRGLCLGGGATMIVGNLAVTGAVYGKYNHGSLEVGGTTLAPVILSNDFEMDFHDQVACEYVLSYNGMLNIPAHYEDDALADIMDGDLLDMGNSPIDDAVMDALFENRPLLRARSATGSKRAQSISKEGRARLASLALEAASGTVRQLDLGRCDLQCVPEEIAQYVEATSLSLEENWIGSLPDALASLQQLDTLNLKGCKLAILPDWVATLPRLRVLNIEGNDLTALPDVAGGFAALESLQVGNTFTDSDAHAEWVQGLHLAQFPRLRSFRSHLNVSAAYAVHAGDEAWHSSTLEYLQITPMLTGSMPACLLRMPQLRCLDLQLSKSIAPSALTVFAQLTQLEALQLSYGKQDPAFNTAVAKALPGTLIRLNNTSDGSAEIAAGKRSMGKAVYERAWETALLVIAQQMARVQAAWASVCASDHEEPARLTLTVLSNIAMDLPAGLDRRARIDEAAAYAGQLLQAHPRVTPATWWWLSFSLGELRANCLITQAWWLLRREQPDVGAALALLDTLESELMATEGARHVRTALRKEIAALRAIA